jgi:hypothetical protein
MRASIGLAAEDDGKASQNITLLVCLLCLTAPSCAPRSVVVTNAGQSDQQMRAETERAFELERRADLVIEYERLDDIRLWASGESAVGERDGGYVGGGDCERDSEAGDGSGDHWKTSAASI